MKGKLQGLDLNRKSVRRQGCGSPVLLFSFLTLIRLQLKGRGLRGEEKAGVYGRLLYVCMCACSIGDVALEWLLK